MVLVTPGYNWVYVCDADAFGEIFRRRDGFPRPAEMLGERFSLGGEGLLRRGWRFWIGRGKRRLLANLIFGSCSDVGCIWT